MDFRSAIIGALVGAGAVGAAWWLVGRDEPARADPQPMSMNSAATESPVRSPAPASAPVSTINARSGESPDVSSGEARHSEAPSAPGNSRATPGSQRSPSESASAAEPGEPEISTSNASRTERQKETKDIDWSYATEQMLR